MNIFTERKGKKDREGGKNLIDHFIMSSGGGGESQPHLRVSAGTAQSINNSVRYFSFDI